MKKVIWFVVMIFTLTILVGCAMRSSNLKRESAREFKVHPNDIEITNENWGMIEVAWNVKLPNGAKYNCFADEYLRRIHCVPMKKK